MLARIRARLDPPGPRPPKREPEPWYAVNPPWMRSPTPEFDLPDWAATLLAIAAVVVVLWATYSYGRLDGEVAGFHDGQFDGYRIGRHVGEAACQTPEGTP